MNAAPAKKSRYDNHRLPTRRERKPNQTQSQPPQPNSSKTTTAQPSRPRFTRMPPRLSTDLLLSFVLGMKRIDLSTNFNQPVAQNRLDRLRELVKHPDRKLLFDS